MERMEVVSFRLALPAFNSHVLGQPGGNIRQAYLYRSEKLHPVQIPGVPVGAALNATAIVKASGKPFLRSEHLPILLVHAHTFTASILVEWTQRTPRGRILGNLLQRSGPRHLGIPCSPSTSILFRRAEAPPATYVVYPFQSRELTLSSAIV
jgi:hypothetical protein